MINITLNQDIALAKKNYNIIILNNALVARISTSIELVSPNYIMSVLAMFSKIFL